MDHLPVDQFKQALLKLKQQILEAQTAPSKSEDFIELDQAKVGRLSRMDALQTKALHDELERRRDWQLQRIESALARIGRGAYGLCLRCNEQITSRRLESDPAATLCFDCQAERD